MGFQTGSDNERIEELERQLDDILDSQINSFGGNDSLSIDSTLGQRNDASGDAGGIRSNQPIIHNITENDASGTPTGVFDKINLISSMIIVDHTSTPIDLRFIQGPAKDGAKIKITVKKDKSLVIKSGGNILTSSDIAVSDTEYIELVKHSEAETGVTGGAFKVIISVPTSVSSPPFIDSNPLVKGSVDATKLLRFEVDGFTTATTRVVTVPNASFTMAGLEVTSQTWTGTNIFAGNTTVRDTNFFIQNTIDITKQAKFDLAGATTGKVITLEFNHTDNRTLSFPNSTTTIPGLGVVSQTWTGTNDFVGITTVIDSNFGIKDFSDNTKVAVFDSSLISAGTTRTYSLPNSTTTLGGLGVVSQTWTGTNIFAGNTTVRDTNFFIQNTTDITKQLKFDIAGATTGKVLTLDSNHTDNRTLSFPNSTTTIPGLGVVSQTWAGTNDFVGITTVIDSNFGIKDFSDNTKVGSFNTSLITTGATRTYSLPNSTTTLAGLGVVTQTWTGTNIFFGPTFINGDITLGDSNADSITFIGDTVGDITPNVDNTDDLGSLTQAYAFSFVMGGAGIIEGYATGFRPALTTDTCIIFTVPTAGGKTELRGGFQTGSSIIIATEP